MRFVFIGILLGLAFSPAAQAKNPPHDIKIKVEASAWAKSLLLQKLNDSGRFHGLHFDESEQVYDYRVVFETNQDPAAAQDGQMNDITGSATVFDAQGNQLFDFKREGRFTESGVTNAVAKEIVKRLHTIRSQLPN
jgi:hypothetical protein